MRMKRISYVIFLIGLAIFMYPQVMKLMADTENKQQLVEYEKTIETITKEEIKKDIEAFQEYNNNAVISTEKYVDPFIEEVIPEKAVNPKVIKNGAFGYLEIPKIKEILPIYLGATENNLAKGVAQMESTSIPIGGMGTNSVIAGHRGYYGANMFRYLDQLEVGDRIYIYTYGMTLTYEVTGSEVINPYQTEKLEIEPDKDQVTLLTCTPYRVSTHRLLIHTRRILNDGKVIGKNPVQTEYAKVKRINLNASPKFMSLTEAITTTVKKLAVSSQGESVNSTTEGYVDNISSVASNSKIFTYAVVGMGSVLWVVVFGMFLGTFRKKKQ